MRCSILPVLAAVSFVAAAPANKRQDAVAQDFNAPPGGDITILNYALTLEFLERNFYQGGLKNFTQQDFRDAGFPDPFYENLKGITFDEETHVSFLAGALGDSGVKEASYSFPYTDPKSFVALSSVLEGVGVSAYLGAAAAIADKTYLPIAGSILTVESRHSAYIRSVINQNPFPKPFDTPMNFNQVFSLAAQFITGFAPGAAPLPFKAFPPLVVAPSDQPYIAGSSSVTFTGAKTKAVEAGLITGYTEVYAVLFSGLDKYYVRLREDANTGDFTFDRIPGSEGGVLPPTGQVYIVLSTADGYTATVNDSNTISGVGIIEVNPFATYETNEDGAVEIDASVHIG